MNYHKKNANQTFFALLKNLVLHIYEKNLLYLNLITSTVS